MIRPTRFNNKTIDAVRKTSFEYDLIMTTLNRLGVVTNDQLKSLVDRKHPTDFAELNLSALPINPSRVNNKLIRNFLRTPLCEAVVTDLYLLGKLDDTQYTQLTRRDPDIATAHLNTPDRPALRSFISLTTSKYRRLFQRSLEHEIMFTILQLTGALTGTLAAVMLQSSNRLPFATAALPEFE